MNVKGVAWLAATCVPVVMAAREFLVDVVVDPAPPHGWLLVRRAGWRRALGWPSTPTTGEACVFTDAEGRLQRGVVVTTDRVSRSLVETKPGRFMSVPVSDIRGEALT